MQQEAKRAESELAIKNTLGLHARPATLLVQLANKYNSEITVEKDGETVNGKSLMGLLMLSAGCGSLLKFIAEGDDCCAALQAIEELIERKFDEED